MQKQYLVNGVLAIATAVFIGFFNFSTANPVLSSKPLSDMDTVIIDSSAVPDDTTIGDVEPVGGDTICYRIGRGGSFEIHGTFGSGTPPPFAWIKVGGNWYGPVPNNFVLLPNTYVYSSSWFDHMIESPYNLGCVNVRFTYNANFYSHPSFTRRVCPCNGIIIGGE